MKVALVTSIYSEFWGTEQFRKSVKKLEWPLFNAWKGEHFNGHGHTLKYIYETYKDLKNEFDYAVYSDGADTYCVRNFIPKEGKIVYSTEKACYPYPWMAKEYPSANIMKSGVESPWKYLNGGNCSGPIELLIEFYEKYGLLRYDGQDVNGQLELSCAYLDAIKDGFPIELDTNCEYFQSIAFQDGVEFGIIKEAGSKDPEIANMWTGTKPAIFHGNGRTDMEWIYNLYK